MRSDVVARKARLETEWADGETYTFALPIASLLELQEKTGAGPQWIRARLDSGTWHVRDITETIRLGLIGGGMDAAEAKKMVRRYVEPPRTPLMQSVPLARAILDALLVGVPDEPPKGQGEGKKNPDRPSRTERSGSENFTEWEALWD